MFMVLRGRVLILYIVLLSLLVGLFFALWLWLNTPSPPPRLGLDASSTALARELVPNLVLGEVQLGSNTMLQAKLAKGELDYLVELAEPTPDLESNYIGKLQPVLVVPFFDSREDLTLRDLSSLLETSPDQVLISEVLALNFFPWTSYPVRYLASEEVVEALSSGQGQIGVIPLQDRKAQVRAFPLPELDTEVYLSRAPKNFATKLKERYLKSRGVVIEDTSYANPGDNQISFLAVGDIMLNRDVEKVGLQRGWEYIFTEVAPVIQGADLAFANLESPIGDEGHFINMFQAPAAAMQGVAFAGFDVVSLANNHTLDYHIEGMYETMRLLREFGIDWVGAGANIQEARKPLIREIGGVKLGFLSYTEMWFVHAREPISWQATDEEPGVAPAELELIVEDVENLRDLVDVVIVSVHWGKEYVHEPTNEQRALARAAVDAGADLVLGHHPHVLQGIEFYNGGVIAYSLGNFVFDLPLARTWETMLLEFTLAPSGILDMKIIPAYIFGVQPQILTGSHRDAVYRQIRHYSLTL